MKILIFISLLLIPAFSPAQNVSGNVKDFHFNNPLEIVSVTLKNNSSGEIVGTDSTDASGNYSIDYIIVSVNQINNLPDNYNLSNAYPNPFNPSTRIDFSAPQQGKFTARIYNIIGQLVYTRDFTIDAGNHSFNISGLGSAGVYLFNLSSDDFTSTQKLLLLDGGSGNINVELTGSNTGRMNKPAYEDLLIEFRKDGYAPYDTVVAWQMNLIIDANIQQVSGTDSLLIAGHITRMPTNTDALGVTIRTYAGTQLIAVSSTNNRGNYGYYINYGYYVDPTDPNNIIYVPSEIRIALSGTNYFERDSIFTLDGSDISWDTHIVQQWIIKQATVSGNVKDSMTQQPLSNASVNVYKAQNDSLLIGVSTNFAGNYSGTYNFIGYDGDPQGVFNNVGDLKVSFNKPDYNNLDTTVTFSPNVNLNASLYKPPYVFNAVLKLYNTKGDIITDLDSLKFTWPDGTTEGFANNNGIVTLDKLLYTLNSDTTAIINHDHPELYLKWFIGTTNNPDRVECLYQNPGPGHNTIAKVPLNEVNGISTELYLVPKLTTYGINNDIPIAMDSPTIYYMFHSGNLSGYVSKFMPSPRGYDTTDVIQLLYDYSNGNPIDSNWILIAKTEVMTFLESTQWANKKLLNYRFTQIPSNQDPFYLYLIDPNGRNRDNVSLTAFGGPNVNYKGYASDGTYRIYRSYSLYSYPGPVIQEEFYCSMISIEFDGPSYVRKLDGTFTDLGKHLIGICHLMKAPTCYYKF